MDTKKELERLFGKEKAKEILKLTKAFDKAVATFKGKMDVLLEESNYEVHAGVVYKQKNTGD